VPPSEFVMSIPYSAEKDDLYYSAKHAVLFPAGRPKSDAALCAELSRQACCRLEPRYADCCDIITYVPPKNFGCEHLGEPYYMNLARQVKFNPPQTDIDKHRTEAEKEYIERPLADHAPGQLCLGPRHRPLPSTGHAKRTACSVTRKSDLTSEGKPRVVVLLSGGMDSCVCAALAARDGDAAAVHISYGQRTEARERKSFLAICERLGIHDRLIVRNEALRAIGGSALTDSNIAVPEWHAIGQDIPVTYVPFRNAHFLAVAVSWAEVLGGGKVYIGAVEQDSSGYPDCRPAYYEAFNRVVRAGTREGRIEIVTPLIAMRKAEIVRLGLELGAPFDLTWSCYGGQDQACGVCDSCVLRLRAFRAAGTKDPIPYAERQIVEC